LDALGVALLAQGRPQEAEEAFRGALQMAEPMDAEWASNNLAVALKAQGSERYGALGKLRRVWGIEKTKFYGVYAFIISYVYLSIYLSIYIYIYIYKILCTLYVYTTWTSILNIYIYTL